ncbi:3451_t:CDS:10 [Ambispora gerdemannii]|uniref:3451_t:CDS:1 n=1 Tax=Ambispora gerdemannii TaxID=144530 RepID=A0A9N8YR10_9GLOM|nr:3451_t:CDS:10 [Ambispora gerdemannii]
MEFSNAVKNLEAIKNIDLQNAVKNLEIPQAVKNIELPQAVKNLEIPQVVKNLDLPNAVKNIELPNAVKNIELPNALRSVPNAVSNAVKDVQIPNNATTRRLSLFATSAFSSVASITQIIQQKVEETTKNIQSEHEAFVKQVKEESIEPNSGTVGLPPWEGLPNEDELKKQMLALSKDKRNFLINPPENTNFQFDLNIYYQTAMAVLNADPNLNRMRFELVPSQVQEPIFWRNYFYRISLIKQTALGSIDSATLASEVYLKSDEELAKETTSSSSTSTSTSINIAKATTTNSKDEENTRKEKEKKDDVKEVLFDAENSGEGSDIWEDELAKVTTDTGGKVKRTKKFAQVKRLLNPNDSRLPQAASSLFFRYNKALGPPYHILVDTNFINFSIQNKLELVEAMMDCLYAKCIPCVTDCVIAELEKLGPKYRIALRVARDPRFERLPCTHKGTYADDCLVQRVTQHKCYIIATCDRDLKRRIRKIPGIPIMYISKRKYTIERLPEAYGAPA